jgi:hypothetical protein
MRSQSRLRARQGYDSRGSTDYPGPDVEVAVTGAGTATATITFANTSANHGVVRVSGIVADGTPVADVNVHFAPGRTPGQIATVVAAALDGVTGLDAASTAGAVELTVTAGGNIGATLRVDIAGT